MQSPPRRHNQVQVYQRRAKKEKVEGNAEEIMDLSVPVIGAEQKPVLVYARREQQLQTGLRAELADSGAAMSVLGEEGVAGGSSAGVAKLLDAFSVDDVALTGISFTQLLNSSSAANLASFSTERGSAVDNGDREYRQADKEDEAHPNESTSRADPSNPSTPPHNSPKIRKLGIDLNKTPRQTPRKKKHPTPKIYIEGKPLKTPKAKTQGNGSSTGKKKYVRKNAVKVVEGLSTPAVMESKHLSKGMESPITPEKDALEGHSDPGFESSLLLGEGLESVSEEAADPSRENSCKRFLNFDDESHLQDTKKPKASMMGPGHTEDLDLNLPPPETIVQTRVQSRGSRRSQCLVTSKIVGPNFPNKSKQRRTAGLRKAMRVFLPYLRKKFKKKRSPKRCRVDMTRIKAFIADNLTKTSPKRQPKIKGKETQTSANVKEMKEKPTQCSAQEENDAPACNLMPETPPKKSANNKKAQKTAEKKAQRAAEEFSKKVEILIHKLMHLSIEEEVQALVPYKPKQKTPKVLLDGETMRAWNLLMTLPSADGDSNAEEERQREENWERERIKFRERVEQFSSTMHVILGDRRFTAWKGSVVDSVVGVFLTQNVSDFLSSSAFMAVCAKFPPKSEIKNKKDAKVGEWPEPIVEHPPASPAYDSGPIDVHELETDVVDGIRTRPSKIEDECSGVTEERGCVQALPPVSTESSSPSDISPAKENQLEGEGSSLYTPSCSLSQESSLYTPSCSLSQESSSNMDSVIKKTDSESVPPKVQELVQETVETNTVFEGTSEQKHVHVVVDTAAPTGKKKTLKEEKKVDPAEWVKLGRMYSTDGPRPEEHMDSVDWEAVRCAKLEEVAETIRERGQHYVIGSRIQEFLNRVLTLHGSIDLEWLRHCPPDKVKDYLLDVNGLGLKSVECVRLLCLQNMAFPVDTNVGRIAVRLGWVPLQPLPDNLRLHLLEKYPLMDEIQKYLWPRLCTLDQRTLYELHYHLITFGKVFCTKRSPSCNTCPLRGDCKHFASAFASAHPLPAPPEENTVTSIVPVSTERSCSNPNSSLITEFDSWVEADSQTSNCQPIIEEPPSPEPETCSSPLRDIEDLCLDNDGEDEIPTIQLNSSEFMANLRSFNINIPIEDASTALVALTSSASLPLPKLKYVSRLRTEHQVYEIPDCHPLIQSLERREPDDPCPYLLAIWPTASSESSEPTCKCQISGGLCDACQDPHSETVKGTILIPCRTAMRGSFPLNGTYFQVNEVFADHESSLKPIDVPRTCLWDLPRRIAYFGTSTSTIFRGLSTEKIQYCFWRGFVCVRGFDRQSRAPRPLALRFHRSSKHGKGAAAMDDE